MISRVHDLARAKELARARQLTYLESCIQGTVVQPPCGGPRLHPIEGQTSERADFVVVVGGRCHRLDWTS